MYAALRGQVSFLFWVLRMDCFDRTHADGPRMGGNRGASPIRPGWPLARLVLPLGAALLALGWGSTGHRIINTRATDHLPSGMALFIQDSAFFGQHASDADNRKGSDTAEAPKHFIDLERYPGFNALTPNLDSLIAIYGWATVKDIGILPWATVRAYDSLVAQLKRGDWTKAVLTAADIGHYVGDGHQPLHLTLNYDGQYTGNNGIHSRYESTMINTYQGAITVAPGASSYVSDRFGFVLAYCVAGNSLADSILHADTGAKVISGWSGSGSAPPAYTAALWSLTGGMTRDLFQRATLALASLWYSAWVDAGLITASVAGQSLPEIPAALFLQNYPNPFNPVTTITYELPVGGSVDLSLFSPDGREIATLVSGLQSAGKHSYFFDGHALASGVYLCRLRLGQFMETRKLVLLR